jgi:hypothetical protein
MGIRRAPWPSGNVRKEPCALCHCSRIQSERRGIFPCFTQVSETFVHSHLLAAFKSVLHQAASFLRKKCIGLSSCVFCRDNGVPINDSSRKFAVQLIKRVPRQDDGKAAAERLAREKQAEKEKEKQKVNACFFFLFACMVLG